MKKIFFLIVVSIIGLSSCQYNVDRTNIYKVGEAIHTSFIKKDTTILKQVFLYQMDSISESQRIRNKEIQDFVNPELKILKIDTSSGWWSNNLDLFYKKGREFYRIRANYDRDTIGIINISSLYFTNLNEKCKEAKETPYCPSYDIEFKRMGWKLDYYHTTIKNGEIFIKNNSDLDINYIKFRLELKKGKNNLYGETFFNQTVESYKTIYKGDITSINIPAMDNYYTGFKIEETTFYPTLIEVLPKPESDWCIKIEELKENILNERE